MKHSHCAIFQVNSTYSYEWWTQLVIISISCWFPLKFIKVFQNGLSHKWISSRVASSSGEAGGCFYSWAVNRLQDHQWQQRDQGALCSWVSISIGFNLPLYSFPSHSCREVASFPSCTLTDTWLPIKVYILNKDQQRDSQDPVPVIQLHGVVKGHVPAS